MFRCTTCAVLLADLCGSFTMCVLMNLCSFRSIIQKTFFSFLNKHSGLSLVNSRHKGFVESQVLGKLTGYEYDFVLGWFDYLELRFSYKEVRFKTFFRLYKPVAFQLKMQMKSHCKITSRQETELPGDVYLL